MAHTVNDEHDCHAQRLRAVRGSGLQGEDKFTRTSMAGEAGKHNKLASILRRKFDVTFHAEREQATR